MKKPSMDIAPQRKSSSEKPKAALGAAKEKKFSEALGENKAVSTSVAETDSVESQDNQPAMTTKKKFWKDWSKKQRLIFVVVLAIVVAAGLFLTYWYGFAQRGQIEEPEDVVVEDPQGPLDRSPLTGLEVPPATAVQTPMAIVIENLTTVRPQSGLSRADVVYEFTAEGGITRFLVIFASNEILEPELIGPVRSLRSYFVPIGLELLAPVYHVGGAPNALERAREWGMRDVNQFFDSKYFWRDTSVNGQGAPHNMWTRMPEVKYAVRDHSWPQDDGQNIRAWEFKDEASMAERGEINEVHVPFSSGRYNVTWVYDQTKNRFDRYQGDGTDEPFTDRNNEEQITARNVVVQFCETSRIAGDDKGRLDIKNSEGEGDALAFFDGQVVEASWKKENRDARTIFYKRGTDEEIEFIPGQFWVEVISQDKEVTWTEEGEDAEGETIEAVEGEEIL
ncbi:DUF3048 domain-containing protein [Patescibacteria group bacterium]